MKVSITFDVALPENIEVSDEQIEEWLRFELHDNGEMLSSNPLSILEVKPIYGTFTWRRK